MIFVSNGFLCNKTKSYPIPHLTSITTMPPNHMHTYCNLCWELQTFGTVSAFNHFFKKNCIFIRYDLYSKNAITDDLLHILHIYHNALELGENISMSILEVLGIFKAKILVARNERRKKYEVFHIPNV